MPLHTADGQWFTYGVKLPQNLAEIDYYLYSRFEFTFLYYFYRYHFEIIFNISE